MHCQSVGDGVHLINGGIIFLCSWVDTHSRWVGKKTDGGRDSMFGVDFVLNWLEKLDLTCIWALFLSLRLAVR